MTTTYTTADIDAATDSAVVKLGFDDVKEKQREAIRAFVSGKDTFISTHGVWQILVLLTPANCL